MKVFWLGFIALCTFIPASAQASRAKVLPYPVTLVQGSQMTEMQPAIMTKASGVGILPIIGGSARVGLKGSTAEIRLKDSTPEFRIGIAAAMDPETTFFIVRLDVKSNKRETDGLRITPYGTVKTKPKKTVSVVITEIKVTPSYGMRIYSIRPATALSKGEYALTTGGSTMSGLYDFGVD